MGKGTGGENEPDDQAIHPQRNEHREGVREKNSPSARYLEWETLQMSWVLYAYGGCRRASKTQDVYQKKTGDIPKVETISYDFLVAGFRGECALLKLAIQ